jgi:hypothetical protein
VSARERLVAALAPPLAAGLVRTLGLTLRLTVTGVDALLPLWAAPRPVIYVVWHGRILMVPWVNERLRRTHGARRAAVLISRSRDGELMARYVGRFGLEVVRGSSSRGGGAALRSLVATIGEGRDVAIVPDGPRGPRGEMQPGPVALAALTGAPIVAVAVSAWPARRLRTWDEFLIPAPFARCAAVFGAPVAVPAGADRERARKEIERTLAEVTEAADRQVGR